MEIRPACPDDIEEVARLWATAFPGKRTIEDRILMLQTGGRYGGLETVLVALEERRLAAAAKIYAMEEHITGRRIPMMGLAAVATAPAMRRRGIAGRLCAAAVDAAVARGDVVSVLYPFRPDYYERLGWGLVGRLIEHRFATAALKEAPEARAVRPARLPADLEGITACYDTVAAAAHGPIARDRRVWAYRLTGEELGVRPLDEALAFAQPAGSGREVLVHDDAGIAGYALLHYRADREASRRTVVVRELVAATEAGYRGLLGRLAGMAASWPRAKHFARPEERFADRLRDPRPPGFRGARSLYFPTGRVVQGPMVRLLDVPAALLRRRWFDGAVPAPGAVQLTVRTRDEMRPANTGVWSIRIDEAGSARSEVLGEEPGTVDARAVGVDAGVATLGRIWAGELAPSEAARLGLARLSGDAGLLDAAFAVRHTFWLLDEF